MASYSLNFQEYIMAFRYEMTAAGADQVQRVEVEDRAVSDRQVKVRINASSMNFHDYITLSGLIPRVSYPTVPLSDGCGEIVSCGKSVSTFAVGDRVMPLFHPHWKQGRPNPYVKRDILGESMDGCLQEFLYIDADSVVKAPENLSDAEAATLGCAGLTAWYSLMEENTLQAKHTVLLQGTGGVSLAALQIAKAVGAKVVITSSSDHKLEKAKVMGADYLINYKTYPNWEEKVNELTGGVNIALDTGGENTLGRAVKCTKDDGFIAVIGILSGFGSASVSIMDVMQKNITIKGITVGCKESYDRLCRFVETHDIRPVISHSYKASELAEAVNVMSAGSHFGKISIVVD
jgi:NADPH:quinone reductase-like Zn-dependent oxidoreductase